MITRFSPTLDALASPHPMSAQLNPFFKIRTTQPSHQFPSKFPSRYCCHYGTSIANPSAVFVPNSSVTISEQYRSFPDSRKKTNNPIVVIDNYDSFTYNLCQYIGELGCKLEVYRNDDLTVDELKRKNPDAVLISPGPGSPQDSGISLQTVLELGPTVPLLGVCMGLQCIGEAFGGKVVRSPYGVMHGKSSFVHYDEKEANGLFFELSNPFIAGRYHSLVIDSETFPEEHLEITAWTDDGLVMAARHKIFKHVQGVQFHPESIISVDGKIIIRNFLNMVEKWHSELNN